MPHAQPACPPTYLPGTCTHTPPPPTCSPTHMSTRPNRLQGVDPAAVVQELLKDKLPDAEGPDAEGREHHDMFTITF